MKYVDVIIIKLMEDFLKKDDLKKYELYTIYENDENYIGYTESKSGEIEQDTPILILDKSTNEIKIEYIPPFEDDGKLIWENINYIKENLIKELNNGK